ncbi:MAG: thioredoxin [Duganella sp.]
MQQGIISITDATFDDEVLTRGGVVLLDFWAEWCRPCKMLAPILSDIADDYQGALRVAKINADDNQASAERYAVRGLPTLLLFVDGVERERLVGSISKTRLAAVIDNYLEA